MHDGTDWVDLVTLAAPRPTITRSISSLLELMDRGPLNIRWIVHLDWIDCLADDFDDCLSRILALVPHFERSVLMTAHPNVGHAGAFLRCLQHVRHDFLYWEDDKVCERPFSLEDLVQASGDHISLQGRVGRPGHTSASFWRRRVAARVVEMWPENTGTGRLERWLKRLCRRSSFRGGRALKCARDVGLEHLAERGVVRQQGKDGNPLYVHSPQRLTLFAFVTEQTRHEFLRVLPRWQWTLCIRSFRFLLLRTDDLAELDAPGMLQFPANRLPRDPHDEVGYRHLLQRLCEADTEFTGYLHPAVRPGRKATTINYDALLRYDLIADPARLPFIAFFRTRWLKQTLQELARREGGVTASTLWQFVITSGAKTRKINLSRLGLRIDRTLDSESEATIPVLE